MNFLKLRVGMSTRSVDTISETQLTLMLTALGANDFLVQPTAKGGKNRIIDVFFLQGFVSKILCTQLPGEGTILLLQQTIELFRPVYVGDVVVTTVTIQDLDPEEHKVALYSTAEVAGHKVGEGKTVIMLIP